MSRRELVNLEIVPFEKENGYGVDLMLKLGSKSREIWLVEIKSCNLSISDVHDAVRQFESTENSLPSNNISIRRVLLHDNKGGCKVTDKALVLLRNNNIYYISVSQGGALVRRLLNIYKRFY